MNSRKSFGGLASRKNRIGRSGPRSRSGCVTCKRRKVRCDETRPVCANCARLGTECVYQQRPSRRGESTATRAHPGQQQYDMPEDNPTIDQDSGVSLGLENPTLCPENNSLFFNFDDFSRNVLDLWCSPSTAFPELQHPELPDSDAIDAMEIAGHGGAADFSSYADHEFSESIAENYVSSVQDHEGIRGTTNLVHESTCHTIEADLLQDVVPNFKRMATNIALAPYSSNDAGIDKSLNRRSEALGTYFQESVFVPGVTTVDVPSWRALCCQILTMARSSSIISNAVVALSQLHFVMFSLNGGHRRGSPGLRNGKTLAQYLYIFAKERLINGLDLLREKMSKSLRVELFTGLFLLTCFELIDKDDIHRAHQIEWAEFLLMEFDEKDFTTQQIIRWLLLCDVKLVIFGGNGILPRRPPPIHTMLSNNTTPRSDAGTDRPRNSNFHSTASGDLLSPPADRLHKSPTEISRPEFSGLSMVSTLKESILRDAVYFHHRSQQFLRKIAMLDRHRRPRGSHQDEIEVSAAAGLLINDLHRLWNERPVILDTTFVDLQVSLNVDLARDIYRLLCIFQACFWSNFCYVYRAAWWDESPHDDEKSAADQTWRALRGSVDQPIEISGGDESNIRVGNEPLLNSAAMWALFTFATECSDSAKVSWCISKLRQLSQVKQNFGSGGEYASIHAAKAARLLQEVVDRQRERGGRADVRYCSLELFGFMFPIL